MNAQEHLLMCLGEEGAEVSHIVAKCLRFGLDDRNVLDPTGPTNRERLVAELNDLMAVARMLALKGVIPMDWEDMGARALKCAKVAKFMDYAQEKGTLT